MPPERDRKDKVVLEQQGAGPVSRAGVDELGLPRWARFLPLGRGARLDVSLLVLFLANLIPLAGVVAFGWDVGAILVLYWSENLVIGFYSVLKILLAGAGPRSAQAGKLFMVPFFCVHFGGFCAVHGVFVFMLTKGMLGGEHADPFDVDDGHWPGPLIFVGLLVRVVTVMWGEYSPGIILPLVALFVSHGISFYENYLKGGEFRHATVQQMMGSPYGRIVLLHVAIIAGGVPVALLGSPLPLLALLVVGKIGMDVALHRRSHAPEKFQRRNRHADKAG